MTTAPSSRSRSLAAIAVVVAVVASTPASAHRRDEYLQAARIAIDPASVQIELDLTPGIALAHGIVADIDRDGNGSITGNEAQTYAARVVGDIRLDVDARPLTLKLINRRFPAVAAMFNGEGTIQLHLGAALPPLLAGVHRVRYRNDHRPDIAVRLANAVMPENESVSVLAQRRDVDQRELVIEYTLREATATAHVSWLPAGAAGAIAMLAVVLWRRSG